MAQLVVCLSGGHRHAVPGRKAPRHDAGRRSVWRRVAPTTRAARVPRQRGDRTACQQCLCRPTWSNLFMSDLVWCFSAFGVCPGRRPSRAPWNKWGDPLAGGNRLCRERPLIGVIAPQGMLLHGVRGSLISPHPIQTKQLMLGTAVHGRPCPRKRAWAGVDGWQIALASFSGISSDQLWRSNTMP